MAVVLTCLQAEQRNKRDYAAVDASLGVCIRCVLETDMKPDYLSYSRASMVALLGLTAQILMGVGLLIYSVLGRDHAAQSAAYAILLGGVVWVTLAIVFDQHRRERLEALETEQLDAAQKSSVFAGSGEELRVQARRLAWMHKFMVPAVSLALAGILIWFAWWRISDAAKLLGYDKFGADLFAKPMMRGWAIAIGLGLGVVGFIFGRFVSGMAKQKVWANLRAGAAYAVLASVSGLAMAVAHFIDAASRDDALRYLQIILPALAGFLGLEILVSLLLNMYRPRKPGEVPRAAFDSPVLGFIASPDRIAKSIGGAISYQVGVDVTGTWAYQLIARAVLPLVLMGAAVMWLMTCVSVVGTNEQGIRVRNGESIEKVGPGIYFKLPWPMESIDRIETSSLMEIDLATPSPGSDVAALLWTNDHKVKEQYAITRAAARKPAVGGSGAGANNLEQRDISVVAVRVPLRFRISDVEKWERFGVPGKREDAVKALAQREVMLALATITDDELIGAGRKTISETIYKQVVESMAKAEAGIEVLYVGIENVHPQKEVARAFENIVRARQGLEELSDKGRASAIATLTGVVGNLELARNAAAELAVLNELKLKKASEQEITAQTLKVEGLLLNAGGKAGALLAEARAYRWERHMNERGNANAYAGRLAAFKANPMLYKARLYYDMLHDTLSETRLYLIPDSMGRTNINIKLEETGATNVLTNPENK